MPLISEFYDLADGQIKLTYKSWRRVSGSSNEPFFIPAPQLRIDLGDGPVDYSSSEVTPSQLLNPSASALTVTVQRTVDTGATLFTVLLPDSAIPGSDPQVARIEAVAIITTIRTFLGNVGKEFPAECYSAQILGGTYKQSVDPA